MKFLNYICSFITRLYITCTILNYTTLRCSFLADTCLYNNFFALCRKIFRNLLRYILMIIYIIWRPPRKSGSTPKTIDAIERLKSIRSSPQKLWELTHSSSEASILCMRGITWSRWNLNKVQPQKNNANIKTNFKSNLLLNR